MIIVAERFQAQTHAFLNIFETVPGMWFCDVEKLKQEPQKIFENLCLGGIYCIIFWCVCVLAFIMLF